VPAGSARADEGTWDIQTVDDIDVNSTSIALDSHGYPHISYTTANLASPNSLHYARWTGTDWVKEMVDDVPAMVTSLALDSNDLPHIGYTTATTAEATSLHYARWTGTAWVKEMVDDVPAMVTSLALDSNDRPHISYTTGGLYSLHYAHWTGTAWAKETVDESAVISTSIALDSNDRPHISYATVGTYSLHYAHWTGAAWAKETVDESAVISTSIALDSNGYPHISYATADLAVGSLHYARWTGTAWAKETIDPAHVFDTSLALDSHDRPHISYLVGSGGFFDGDGVDHTVTGMLKYAHWTGSAWDIQTLDQETTTWEGLDGADGLVGIVAGGKWSSIALDGNDLPNISYGNLAPGSVDVRSLHYARFIPLVITPTIAPPAKQRVSPRTPASMSVQSLSINPKQAYANQSITITTNVVNTGGEAGSLNVALKINGQVEQTKIVSVGPQGTQPVKFTVTKAQPGTYTVDIGGQKGSFTILGVGGSTAGTSSSDRMIGILIIIGALVLVTVLVVWLLIRRPA
jgi:hypothetical protein